MLIMLQPSGPQPVYRRRASTQDAVTQNPLRTPMRLPGRAGGVGMKMAKAPATTAGCPWCYPADCAADLGLTFLYWQSERRTRGPSASRTFEVAADQIAYNLKDRMATYGWCCAASRLL